MKQPELQKITVSVSYEVSEDIIRQKFSYNKRLKIAKLLSDPRYIVQDKLRKKVRGLLLTGIHSVVFIKEIELDDGFEFIYEIGEDFSPLELTPTHFTIMDIVPPNPGCEFCIYKEERGDFIHCDLKKKLLTKELKTCKVFRQRLLI